MNVFVLHAGQPELGSFLQRLRVPSGTVLPRAVSSEPWTVVSLRRSEGRRLPEDAEGILQPDAAVRRALQSRLLSADLRRNGIRTAERATVRGNGCDVLTRAYVIPVFQLEALGVYAAGGVNGPIGVARTMQLTNILASGTPEASKPTVLRRAERAAVRAAYALGLDYAVVGVKTDPGGFPLIESVDPTPACMTGPFAALFAEAVNRLANQTDPAGSESGRALLLGMDPEFVLRKPGPDGKIVSASRYFERRGRVGCDSVRIGDKLIYPLAELRPSPAAEPKELFRNLYAAMRLAASRIDDTSLEWLAGGMPAKGLPLGGHIHVSGVSLNADLLRAMDNYLALPLVLIEDSTTKRRRPRYGALGDFRRQFHGGFEYRTLPSWIVSPAVAMGVISLARVVCEHYRELRERPLARPDVQKQYYAGNKEALRPTVLALWNDLERTAAYARYAKPLNRLKRAVERMEPWNEQQDFRILWKIPTYRV